jgi:hypothetical protein
MRRTETDPLTDEELADAELEVRECGGQAEGELR